MRSPLSRVIPGLLLLSLAIARPAVAMDATVPTGAFPDIQTAVAALALSVDPDNTIFLANPSILTSSVIFIGNAFSGLRTLTIRPATTLARAQILSTDVSGAPILSLIGCGSVHVEDVDIVRVITNNGNLVRTENTSLITFERCRIGSDAPPNASGLCYMFIAYPADGGVTVKNSIFFSTYKTAFDFGLQVITGDPSNELFLYNDCIADYNQIGLFVNDSDIGSLILARNDVFVNNVVSFPEPTAVVSSIAPGVIVVTSDNLAFASPAKVQAGFPPNQDLFGTAASQAPVDLPATLPVETSAFATMVWNSPPGDPNPGFYRTLAAGPLHAPSAYGVTVGLKTPDVHDQAVLDDFDRSIRPGGAPVLHTDRGPFQVDPSASGVGDFAGNGELLRVAPPRNPSRAMRLEFASRLAGDLQVDVFDVSGRRVAGGERLVGAGESGEFAWPAVRHAGLYLWRARLAGAPAVSGRVSLLP